MTFDDLLAKHGRLVTAAFRKAIENISSNVILKVVTERLEAGDIQGAMDAIQVDGNAFGVLERALQDAFADGGDSLLGELPKLRMPNGPAVVWQFSIRNPSAEALLKEQSSNLITRIVNDQKTAIRAALVSGLEAGKNPTATALDIVGRVDRKTGKRTGGIVGLTSKQEEWQRNYAKELASNDAEDLRHALTRGLRDKRFDSAIKKAIASEKPIPAATRAKMLVAYRNRSLKYRGDVVGRTETLAALSNARQNAIQQQVESGKIQAGEVTKVWDATGDARTRDTHKAMEGQRQGFNGAFISPSGAVLRYPHDPQAPASETVQCRCRVKYDIDHIAAGLRKYKARVNG